MTRSAHKWITTVKLFSKYKYLIILIFIFFAYQANLVLSTYVSKGSYEDDALLPQQVLEDFDHTSVLDVETMENILVLVYRLKEASNSINVKAIHDKTFGEAEAIIINNLALVYEQANKLKHAELLYQFALEIQEEVFGRDHPTIAVILNNLAVLYAKQKKFKDAEPLFQRALEIKEKQLGRIHPDVAKLMNNLASFYYNQGKYQQVCN